jgi:hypothetical protein
VQPLTIIAEDDPTRKLEEEDNESEDENTERPMTRGPS